MTGPLERIRDVEQAARRVDVGDVGGAIEELSGLALDMGSEAREALERLELEERARHAAERLDLGSRVRSVGSSVEGTVDDLAHPTLLRRVRVLRQLARVAVASLGALIVYRRWLRARVFTWGATAEEASGGLPGDGVVTSPRRQYTRAVTVEAPPENVWPWLTQLGQDRGGLYSYDWLENLLGCEMESADHILPEADHVEVGDRVRLVPEDYRVDLHFEVAELRPERALVLKTPGSREESLEEGLPHASWAFVLEPLAGGRSRLLARWRSDFSDEWLSRAVNGWGIELPHFFMERKMLQGIKERAEGGSR